ncbi:hypothetical protein GY45DRAFT_585014 [Cubamyces sp. BRFM 1775]|nr:hypothetical protein GY45DRAFT_585014 [Cubamyces sp. BRFM 1775]
MPSAPRRPLSCPGGSTFKRFAPGPARRAHNKRLCSSGPCAAGCLPDHGGDGLGIGNSMERRAPHADRMQIPSSRLESVPRLVPPSYKIQNSIAGLSQSSCARRVRAGSPAGKSTMPRETARVPAAQRRGRGYRDMDDCQRPSHFRSSVLPVPLLPCFEAFKLTRRRRRLSSFEFEAAEQRPRLRAVSVAQASSLEPRARGNGGGSGGLTSFFEHNHRPTTLRIRRGHRAGAR